MQKTSFIVMGFFMYFQAISASDFIDEFVKRIPKESMEMLQYSLHEKVKKLNYHEKNKVASQKMLHSLNECLTYEIKYLKSQIKNNYFFDQKAAKLAVSFLIIAAVSTYYTYYLYKNSIQAEDNRKCDFLRRNKTICENRVFLASGLTLCSYLIFWVYAYNAYTLDPNRNNEFFLKYQQCLKLVELIQEIQA